jgi:tetratricopeptide (TPR) repeat protein
LRPARLQTKSRPMIAPFARLRLAVPLAGLLVAAGAPPDRVAPLFQALKTAATVQQAAAIESRILGYWHSLITPAVQLLLEHAQKSMAQQDRAGALGDLDAALDLQPEQADLWRLHAEARFANGDDRGAFADLAQALSREPRCFPALADLSRFAESRQDNTRALTAWQKYLDLDPRAPDGEKRLQDLQRKVEGQPL